MRSWFALSSLLSLLLPFPALAQWQSSGTPISATVDDQRVISICPDGVGGAILTWEDYRPGGFNSEVYAQRVNSAGVPQWTANGVAICTGVGQQYQPRIVSDNAGGAIIAWMDNRAGTYDVYAQRVNASGVAQWTANGVVVSSTANDQVWPQISADGAGGAIITWYDNRNIPTGYDIYAQRVNAAGAMLWTANGVALCTSALDQMNPQVVSDGSGGAIVAWRDLRAGVGYLDIYAQRVNSAGAVQWTANGVTVCTAANDQTNQVVVADGAGGAIIAWQDSRSGGGFADIFAQRLNSAGTALWNAGGQVICNITGTQTIPVIVSDGSQGAIIAWLDNRGANQDLYAQRVAGAGNSLWPSAGIPVCTATTSQSALQMITDGAGGAIMTWADPRAGTGQVYAQRLDAFGAAQWAADGVQESTSPSGVSEPVAAPDGAGNALIAWYSYPANDANIYAQRIDGRYGYWGRPEPTLYAVKDVPSDQGGKVRLEWAASGRDVLNQQLISHYSIWRAIDQMTFASAVESGVPSVALSDVGPNFSGKAIRKDAQATEYYWELIGTQDAIYRAGYAVSAATSFDSTATNPATHRFQIVSHASGSQYLNWPSNVLSGRSVDNLAPPAPLYLTAQRTGNYVYLKWNGVHIPDLGKYTVYRATSTGVTPIPPNFLADDTDTLLTDTTAPLGALYYVVTATDIHQNQGVKSNEASVSAATNAGNTPPVTVLTVLQNQPNPFSGDTELRVGLPSQADVSVEVYDVAGRRVRDVSFARQAKGWATLRLDSRDGNGAPLPSGVYFYRVHAGAGTVTHKMVIAR